MELVLAAQAAALYVGCVRLADACRVRRGVIAAASSDLALRCVSLLARNAYFRQNAASHHNFGEVPIRNDDYFKLLIFVSFYDR